MRLACSFGLAMWICLGIGCKDGKPAKASHEECNKAAEHIAELIMTDLAANPDTWWDSVTQQGDSGIPASVTKEGFKTWLDTPEGKTWVMQRRGNTLTGVQQGIDGCVQNASHDQVTCLLAAKDKAGVLACDQKFAKKPPPGAEGSGSGSSGTTNSASGSGSAAGSGSSAP